MTYLPLPLEKNVDAKDFDPGILINYPVLKRRKSKDPEKQKPDILDCIFAFDIEATNIDSIEQAVMYIWQFQVDEDITVFGRTWEEFIDLLTRIAKTVPHNVNMVVYIHNASYEHQFIKGCYDFRTDEVFATERRRVLRFDMFDRFEFRCSYRLSNLSLKDFTRKYRVKHQKLTDYDYNIPRFHNDPLTIEELRYCQNDVLGLVEAIRALLIDEKENLITVPLTSTGFVRKQFKRVVFSNLGYNYAKPFFPSPRLYSVMRRAFRGGDTHGNRFYVNETLKDVSSYDRSSSYPDVICNHTFPVDPFVGVDMPIDRAYYEKLIYRYNRAILAEVKLTNVRLKNRFWGNPYLSRDKSYNIVDGVYFTGRILTAAELTTCITDVDYRIINEEYDFDIEILDWYKSRHAKLPQCMIDFVIKWYKTKTELKGVEGELNLTLYNRSKAMLNSIY